MVTVIEGDSRAMLATLPEKSVQTCVTSPPYFGLRDYGNAAQIGLESTPAEYVAQMVAVFREVRRVLKDDGTLWLNLGDSYAGRGRTGGMNSLQQAQSATGAKGWVPPAPGFKDKDLYGIPWRVALALQDDGWYLRSDIIWAKPNPMPESVTDRPTKSHEYVFLLSKSERYLYNAGAIAEPVTSSTVSRLSQDVDAQQGSFRVPGKTNGPMKAVGRKSGNKERTFGKNAANPHIGSGVPWEDTTGTRNARTVWTISTRSFSGAHFATMAPELAKRCILAGSNAGDTVLDPFGGAGTTGLVADQCGRDAVLVELNPHYAQMARNRITDDAPLFAESA